MEIKLRPIKIPNHNHALSRNFFWQDIDILYPFNLSGISKNNKILYRIKSLKPKNFKKGGFKLNIYSVIPYDFFTNTSENVQKIPDLGDLTNVKNCIPDSIKNINSEPNNIKFFLLMHKKFFLYLNGGLAKLDAVANFNLQSMQIMEYEKAPSILFSKYILFELEYDDSDNNYITDEELDIFLDLKFEEKNE